jgi:hypothetical protein
MRKEYDFSEGERGRFFQEDATFHVPVYLDEANRAFVEKIAQRKNVDVPTVVNELIRSHKEIVGVVVGECHNRRGRSRHRKLGKQTFDESVQNSLSQSLKNI